jgi:hypothetical protein
MPVVFPNLAGRTLEVQRVKAALFSSPNATNQALPPATWSDGITFL